MHSVSYFTNLDPAPEQTKAAEDSHDQAGDTAIEPNSEGTTTSGKHNESYNIRATGANILDPTHGYGIELAEDQQDAPDNVVSGQALNMGATLMYRRYITGKIQMPVEISYTYLKIIAVRPSPSLYNRRCGFSASQYSQARRFWAHKRGGCLGFGKGITLYVETDVCC